MKMNEIAGIGNWNTAEFWEYSTRTARRMNLDPEPQISISDYTVMGGNPIWYSDPSGDVAGDYYKSDGTYLGSDGKNDNKTYTADDKKTTEVKDDKGIVKETKTEFINAEELSIEHTEFQKKAATVYGESSAYRTSGETEELGNEMKALASVHMRNKVAYGGSNAQANAFRQTSLEDRNGTKMQLANAAVINAQTGGPDLSNGATGWDGLEQGGFSADDKRFSTGRFELHKNTIGWSISDDHYSKWKKFGGKGFKAPQISYTPSNQGKFNKYFMPNTIRLKSTAVYNGTIFWKELKGKSIITK